MICKLEKEKMQDRYLFKAKHFNEWHRGNIIKEPDGLYIRDRNKDVMAFINDESTICQCTGLKDKNGKLIWEGDIILFQRDNDDCPFPNKDTKKRLGKVFYKGFRTTFAIGMGKNGSGSINDDLWKYVQNGNRVEVIGNVFDNPDLLGINTPNDLDRHWLEKYTEGNDREKRD